MEYPLPKFKNPKSTVKWKYNKKYYFITSLIKWKILFLWFYKKI